MVAAAFIGPGTVTTATIAGSSHGYTLLWAVLFSVLATLVLQEMAARLGVAGQMGLGKALRGKLSNRLARFLLSFLVMAAILVGNAAYEAGNITGAVLGLHYTSNGWPVNPWILAIGAVAFLLLWSGKYQVIERSLVILVGVMGLVFLVSALSLTPDLLEILKGLFIPTLPESSLLLVVSLIGTTVVPYNLFLHASSAKIRWKVNDLPLARLDTVVSVTGGGIITMAILITSAAAFEGSSKNIDDLNDLSRQLQPLLGNWAAGFMATGFLAAGLSSAITAPLAASYATSEVLGWRSDLRSLAFRTTWGVVLLTGVVVSSLGYKPTMVILLAQFANGLLLPILAVLLVWIMNDKEILGPHVNRPVANILSGLIILITLLLGMKSIAGVMGFWF